MVATAQYEALVPSIQNSEPAIADPNLAEHELRQLAPNCQGPKDQIHGLAFLTAGYAPRQA